MLLFLRGISGLVLAHPLCPGSKPPPSLPPAEEPQPPIPGGFSAQGSAGAATDGAIIYGVGHTAGDWKWIILLVETKGKGEGEKRLEKANTMVSLLVSSSRDMNSLLLIFLCSTQSCLVLFCVLRAKSIERAFKWPRLKMQFFSLPLLFGSGQTQTRAQQGWGNTMAQAVSGNAECSVLPQKLLCPQGASSSRSMRGLREHTGTEWAPPPTAGADFVAHWETQSTGETTLCP